MSKSKRKKVSVLEESVQYKLFTGVRKPSIKPTKVINPKDAQRKHRWDWREEIGKDDLDDFDEDKI